MHTLRVFGGDLYAGGSFPAPGGNYGIARWDGTTWNPVGGGANGSVLALAALKGDVYAGGDFSTAGGVSAVRIAKWNGVSWSPLGSGVVGFVYALAAKGTKVYAGGTFTSAGGVTGTSRVAYWETSETPPAWHALGSGITASPGTPIVYAIAVTDDGTIYVGGEIFDTAPEPDTRVAFLKKWNGSSWVDLDYGPSAGTGIFSAVRALTAKGNAVYVGGKFTSVGNNPAITVKGIAKWSGSAWSGLTAQPWIADGTVRAIAWNGANQMYATGYLPESPDSTTRDQIYLLQNGDNGTWSTTALTPGLFRPSGSGEYGRALAVDRFRGKVYVGGYFDNAGGLNPAAVNVAVWNDLQNFHITDLGPFTSGTFNRTFAVNNSGQAAGYASGYWAGYFRNHAYRLENDVMYELVAPWHFTDHAYAYGINDSGHVVGSADQYGGGTFIRGIKWMPGETPGYTILLSETGWTTTEARSIDNLGRMVGYSLNSQGYYRAVRWDADYTPHDMLSLDLAGGNNRTSYAYGMNSSGRIVGESVSAGNGPFHAFRTTGFGAIQSGDDLGIFPGGSTSEAWGINDFDEVVGAASTASGQVHAFLTKPGKKIDEPGTADDAYDLGVLDTGTASVAYAVNIDGMVVGSSYTWGSQYPEAFLHYRGKPGLIRISSYVRVFRFEIMVRR